MGVGHLLREQGRLVTETLVPTQLGQPQRRQRLFGQQVAPQILRQLGGIQQIGGA